MTATAPKPTQAPSPKRIIRPRCGNHTHGIGACGDGDYQCESCKKENFLMDDEPIRAHRFHPEHYPLYEPTHKNLGKP